MLLLLCTRILDTNYSAELCLPFTALVWVSLLGLQYFCRMTFCHKRLSKEASKNLTAYGFIVQGLLGPDPRVANDILGALWLGGASYTKGKGRDAAGSAFTECLCWLLTQVQPLPHVPKYS